MRPNSGTAPWKGKKPAASLHASGPEGGQDVAGRRTDLVLGQKLRQIRRARGLTQRQVATALDLSLKQVQNYENGRTRIAVATLIRFSTVLRMPAAAILRDLLSEDAVPADMPGAEAEEDVLLISDAELAHLSRLRGMPVALTRPIFRLTEVLAQDPTATLPCPSASGEVSHR